MRIGLFGGTFDPPHRGHLAAARVARDRFTLDRVLLAPVAVQPLKPEPPHATFSDRLRMTELLCAGSPGLEASAIDGPQPGAAPNYTIDTLRRLRAQFRAQLRAQLRAQPHAEPAATDPEIFVIVGADAFLHLRHWRSPDDLLREARWIVLNRPGFDLQALDALRLTPEQRAHVETLPDLAHPVSATEVRDRLRNRQDASALLPAAVLDYIHVHHLYET